MNTVENPNNIINTVDLKLVNAKIKIKKSGRVSTHFINYSLSHYITGTYYHYLTMLILSWCTEYY